MKITVEFYSYEEFKCFEEFFSKKVFVNKKRSVKDLGLTVRSRECLINAGINTIDDLLKQTESSLLAVNNLGRKSVNEVKNVLKELGLEAQAGCFD